MKIRRGNFTVTSNVKVYCSYFMYKVEKRETELAINKINKHTKQTLGRKHHKQKLS